MKLHLRHAFPNRHANLLFACVYACLILATGAHSQARNDGVIFGNQGLRGEIGAQSIDDINSEAMDVVRFEDNEADPDVDERPGEAVEGPLRLGRNVPNQPAGRTQPSGRVGSTQQNPRLSGRSNTAVQPAQSGNAAVDETDPFAPIGMRLGTANVLLSLEQSVGYSSNVSQFSGGEGGAFSQTDLEGIFTTDWSRHEWQTTVNGSFRKPFDGEDAEDLLFSLDSNLRLDLIDGFTLTTNGNYRANTEEFTSTTLAPGAIDTPLAQSYGGSLEVQRLDRKLLFALRGSIQRNTFEDVDLGGGLVQSQDDQNNDRYGLAIRAGYEVSPAIIPFAELDYSIRDFDLDVDRNGNNRDSRILELRGGVQFDLGEKLQGEIAAGLLNESFEDPLLDDLNGFTLNGNINWSPERDSLVTFTLGTQTNNSITLNENGTFIYNAQLDYARQINDRLSMDAFARLVIETNDDDNRTFEIGAGTHYWVNRFMALTADVEYRSFSSNAPDSGFDELSGRLGVRLQR